MPALPGWYAEGRLLRAPFWRLARIAARAFLAARSGSVAVEYGVIAALVSTAIVAGLGTIAGPLGQLIAEIATRVASD